jgi:hypothetical protein
MPKRMMSTEAELRLTVGALLALTGEKQRDLAAAIGITQTQISRKQAGKVSWSLADCDRLSDHYGIPVPDLLSGPTRATTLLPEGRRTAGFLPAPTTPADTAAPADTAEPIPPLPAAPQWFEADRDPKTGRAVQQAPAPCVLCGVPTPYRGAGRPQHLGGVCPDPALLATTAATAPAPAPVRRSAASAADRPTAPPAADRPTTPAADRSAAGESSGGKEVPVVERLRAEIRANVAAALDKHQGDIDAAAVYLDKKRALVDVMDLWALSRAGGRYESSKFPPLPDIFHKREQGGADQIWEGRPTWVRPGVKKRRSTTAADPNGNTTVHALDMNAAFLSAFKCHLPIGQPVWDDSGVHDRKKSGVHRITPPAWEHPDLPNPLGSRKEPGPLWVTEPTLRLLQEAQRKDLCDAPVIHESWVSGASEGLLEYLRRALSLERMVAIEGDDPVTLAYVKAMYSKFVSTIGESTANDRLRRPEWVHLIRAQAYANLWRRAFKARAAGLTLVEMSGTDELHVVGDWQQVFPEGRAPNEVKLKKTYTTTIKEL